MEEKGKMTRYLANNSLVRALEKIQSGGPSGAPSWQDYYARPVLTKYHILGDETSRNLFSHSSGKLEAQD